jgi:hypothetical protein
MSIRKPILFALVGAALMFPRAAVADICMQDVCVRFQPANYDAILGFDFTIDIRADINAPVVGWGLDVSMTTPGVIVQNANPTIGPNWVAVNAQDGDHLAGLAFPNDVSGNDILLGTLHFHAVADGATDLLLSVTPGDHTEGFALDPTGFGTTQFDMGHVFVPEPQSLAFMISLGIVVLRFRNAQRSSRTNP